MTQDNEWEKEYRPRPLGKNIEFFAEFLADCRAGKRVAFVLPEGTIYSPAALENRLASEREKVLEEVREKIEHFPSTPTLELISKADLLSTLSPEKTDEEGTKTN